MLRQPATGDEERADACQAARSELALHATARTAGAGFRPLFPALVAFYSNPCWSRATHAFHSADSRRRARASASALVRIGAVCRGPEGDAVLETVLGFLPAYLSPEVTVADRGVDAAGAAAFSVRPSPSGRVLFVRSALLSVEDMGTMYSGFGRIELLALPTPPEAASHAADYAVTFTSSAELMAATEVLHPKILFTGFQGVRDVYSSAELPAYNAAAAAAAAAGARGTMPPASALGAPPAGAAGAPPAAAAAAGAAGERWFPPLLCDNLTYWTTYEQIFDMFKEHGTIKELRFAMNDLNGCHYGCCQVLMSSWDEMAAAEEALDGRRVNGNIMVVGVLTNDGLVTTSKVCFLFLFHILLSIVLRRRNANICTPTLRTHTHTHTQHPHARYLTTRHREAECHAAWAATRARTPE